MRIEKPALKEAANRKKHGVGFALADVICADPLAVTVYDRYENGEDRWHTFGAIQGTVYLLVHTYPDPDADDWIRIIGLRKATAHERRRYEEARLE
jgi:uncharacterized DUF497 family protein